MNLEVLNNTSIVLVGTLYAGNIGSTARAMMNMGITDLRLVNPEEVETEESRNLAVNAWDLVKSASRYRSLQEAVVDSSLVVGTTCWRGRRRKVREYRPREIAPMILKTAAESKVSIVFGSERGGLNSTDLAACQYLVNIPASSELPTLNLAQAVLIICYELFTFLEEEDSPAPPPGFEFPTQEEREQLFSHLEETLLAVGFLSSSNPGHIMHSLRRMLGADNLTKRDIRILHGILSRVDWFREGGRDLPPEKIRRP